MNECESGGPRGQANSSRILREGVALGSGATSRGAARSRSGRGPCGCRRWLPVWLPRSHLAP